MKNSNFRLWRENKKTHKKDMALAVSQALTVVEKAIRERHGLFDLPLIVPSTASPAIETKLLSPRRVASLLGISEKTLANWRCSGTQGLPHTKIGSRIFYRSSDVHAFILNNSKQSTSDKLEGNR